MAKQQQYPNWMKEEHDPFWQERSALYLNRGHCWKEDEDGIIDVFAYAIGHHAGPVCVKCGWSRCWHCYADPGQCPNADRDPFDWELHPKSNHEYFDEGDEDP